MNGKPPYLSARLPEEPDAATLSAWLDAQDVTLSPETLSTVLTCAYDWLCTYYRDGGCDLSDPLAELRGYLPMTAAKDSQQPSEPTS